MFKRILIPTDGSDISQKAVAERRRAGPARMGAELFAISVKEPFPYSAISEMQPVPPQEFFDAQERIAGERVKAVVERGRRRRRDLPRAHGRGAAPLGSHPRPCQDAGLRPDRDGLARPQRPVGAAAGQRDAEGADALQHSGAGRSSRTRRLSRTRGAGIWTASRRGTGFAVPLAMSPEGPPAAAFSSAIHRLRRGPTAVPAWAAARRGAPRRCGDVLVECRPCSMRSWPTSPRSGPPASQASCASRLAPGQPALQLRQQVGHGDVDEAARRHHQQVREQLLPRADDEVAEHAAHHRGQARQRVEQQRLARARSRR